MRRERGQSLIEVIIAATVGILVVTALTFATLFSLRNANFAKNSAQATKLAQEGIEKLRTARNRNERISNLLPSSSNCLSVGSWDGGGIPADQPIWNCKISDTFCSGGSNCYFRFSPSSPYELIYYSSGVSFPSTAEDPLAGGDTRDDGKFQRVVIMSDETASSLYTVQKTATIIVRWNDATGPHDSKLTTILRKL